MRPFNPFLKNKRISAIAIKITIDDISGKNNLETPSRVPRIKAESIDPPSEPIPPTTTTAKT